MFTLMRIKESRFFLMMKMIFHIFECENNRENDSIPFIQLIPHLEDILNKKSAKGIGVVVIDVQIMRPEDISEPMIPVSINFHINA